MQEREAEATGKLLGRKEGIRQGVANKRHGGGVALHGIEVALREAGAILRQLRLDSPRIAINVFTPDVLVSQWQGELATRFDLPDANVAPYAAISDFKAAGGMLLSTRLIVYSQVQVGHASYGRLHQNTLRTSSYCRRRLFFITKNNCSTF